MENQIQTQNAMLQEATLFTNFEKLTNIAEYLSKSDILPETFKSKPANVFIALDMAQRMGMNPFMVCQNIYMVHGKPAWSSSFLIACINACGKFSNLDFEFRNDSKKGGLGCRAMATRLSDGKLLEGSWITMAMAEQEGWTRKAGSKWITMPEQMLRYRAAAFWQRTYAPEVSMGIRDEEEVRDMTAPVQDAQYTEIIDEKPAMSKAEAIAAKQIERMKAKEAVEGVETPTAEAETEALGTVAGADAAKNGCEVKEHIPYVGIHGTMMVWDEQQQKMVDSGISKEDYNG